MSRSEFNPRAKAAELLHRILKEGAFSNRLLDGTLKKGHWDEKARRLLTELTYGCLRKLYVLDRAIDRAAKKGIKSIKLRLLNHLRVATYQILFLDKIPNYAAIHEAVEIIKAIYGPKVGGFSNALLKKIAQNPPYYSEIPSDLPPAELLSLKYSHPRWLVEMWLERWGFERTERRLSIHNTPAPLTLRVQPDPSAREVALRELEKLSIEAEPTRWSPFGINILSPLPTSIERFLKDFPVRMFPQDEGAQLVVLWMDPSDGDEVLDACAAPGGKTTLIAILAPGAFITASDIHPKKIQLIEKLFRRLGLPTDGGRLNLRAENATLPLGKEYDKILCDAPCSSLGIIRRQPEVRYRRTSEELRNIAQIQFLLVKNLLSHLKPGGSLVYSVCTDTPEENELLVERVLGEVSGVKLDPAVPDRFPELSELIDGDGFLRTFPEEHGADAFFAAKFRRF